MNYAVILAGGIGSRFWPLSRKYLPKQFLKFIEKESLLEATIRRIKDIISPENIFIITGQIHLKEIKQQLAHFNIPLKNILLEPHPLNTLPAIGLSAKIISFQDHQANLLIFPSDHYIKNTIGFKNSMQKAIDLSRQNFLCLVGIRPDKPHPGYGYIKIGSKIKQDIFYVNSFFEKPTINRINRFLKKKNVFWNSGIFCFNAITILNEIRIHHPRLFHMLEQIRYKKDIRKIWKKIKPVSIDCGLLEKSKNLAMVIGKFYWSDIGSWDSLCDILPKDKNNNIKLSSCISLDTGNSFIFSQNPKRTIATLGLRDSLIIDTPDALLVCKKERSQDIKRLVEILNKNKVSCV